MISYDILLNASKPSLLENVDLDVLKEDEKDSDELHQLKDKFRQTLKRVKREDAEYPYPPKVWSRPREHFPYEAWMEEDFSRNGMYMKEMPFLLAIRELKED